VNGEWQGKISSGPYNRTLVMRLVASNMTIKSIIFPLLDTLHDGNWIQNLSEAFATQKVIECLAINRSITLEELIIKTDLKEDEIIAVLHNHTIFYLDPQAINSTSQVSSDIEVNKQYYINFISHALITKAGNTYELSLFGVMLMISLIRYHYMTMDTDRTHNSTTTKTVLLYNDMKPNEYCDLITKNYNEKLL